ncbi:MAG: DUF1801 domain-containing protein [Bacteroidales bacterium]|nr:DUF1801 domain-containing protein [Bacteroidales bacterium]
MSQVEKYISTFPEPVAKRLNNIRQLILSISPEIEESFSYNMPSYRYAGRVLVYFAAFKNHIGFYATPSGHEEFKNELSKYKQGKGSVQFQHLEPLPISLIESIVRFRMWENEEKYGSAKRKKR